MTIFIADDDKDDLDFFIDAMFEVDTNVEVVAFSSGSALLESLGNDTNKIPDAIFIDLNMPILSGVECVQKIRQNKRFEDIPIVVYSTSFATNTAETLREIGTTLFIQKPSSFSLLKSILERSISAVTTNQGEIGSEIDFIQKESP